MSPAGRASTIFAGAVLPPLWDRFPLSTASQGVQQTVWLWSTAGPWHWQTCCKAPERGLQKTPCRCCKRESGSCTERWSGSPAAQHSSKKHRDHIAAHLGRRFTQPGSGNNSGTTWSQLILEQAPHKGVDPPHCTTAPLSLWSTPLTQCPRAGEGATGCIGTGTGRALAEWRTTSENLTSGSELHQHEQMSCQVWWPTQLHPSFWFYLSEHRICGRQKSPFHWGMLRQLHYLHPLTRLPKRCTTCTVQVRDLARHRAGRGVFTCLGKFNRF